MSKEGELSKNQIDRLGSRLRNSAEPSVEDLRLLDRYRERFVPVHDEIIGTLRQQLGYPLESRHKSVPSIIAKLRRRQPARLSAIQDIAGARIIVSDLAAARVEQTALVERIKSFYPNAEVDDKREKPSYGYRAVHVIVSQSLPFEIQVRTIMQHTWAQLSERLADRYGFELKYGGGPQDVRDALLEYAEFAAVVERFGSAAHESKWDPGTFEAMKQFLARLPAIIEILERT